MATNFKPLQAQNFSLAGSGAILGAVSLVLKSFAQIDGTPITMSDLGDKAYMTLEPGNGNQEEQISFAGVVQNANGTATLSGIKTVLFAYPYTETSGLAKTHPGSTTAILSNTSGFYSQYVAKDNDGTISETLIFTNPNYPRMDTDTPFPTDNEQLATKAYADSLTFSGAPDASTTQKGIVQIATQAQVDAQTAVGSTGAVLVVTPNRQRSTLLSDYIVDTGTINAITLTPSPAISAYTAGQQFSTKVLVTNNSPVTVNVNGLGAKQIYKLNGTTSLAAGDIVAGQVIVIEYDGTNMQLQSPSALVPVTRNATTTYAASATGTDAYAITLTPTISAYVTGMAVRFKADISNTSSATINLNGLGAKSIKKSSTLDLETGDILAGQMVEVSYDGTNFQMESPLATSPKVKIGRFASGTSTSALAVTGVGFKPSLVQFFVNVGTTSGGNAANSVSAGAATAAAQWNNASVNVTNANASANNNDATHVWTVWDQTPAITSQAAFTSMDTDGFTVTLGTAGTSYQISYIAYA